MSDRVPRSRQMVMVGYFLAKYGESRGRGATGPPRELETDRWNHAYSVFFDSLCEGRSLHEFCHSLKNVRDSYDAYLPTGRKGWKQAGADRPPAKLPKAHQSVWDEWQPKPRADLWEGIEPFADLGVSRVSDRVLRDLDVQLGKSEEHYTHTEGGKKVYVSSRVERKPTARAHAIDFHGTSCAVCRLDFGRVYGKWGSGYIEVHHLVPFGDEPGRRKTDPAVDMAVLCANCHRMVHRNRSRVLTVDELRSRLNRHEILEWAKSLADGNEL